MKKLEISDLKEIMKDCNLRDKAVILLMFSSGMSAADVCELNYEDFFLSISEYSGIDVEGFLPFYWTFFVNKVSERVEGRNDLVGTWNIKRPKTGVNYVTFNSNESTHSILNYLINRKCDVKKTISFQEPLFTDEKGNRISKEHISTIFKGMSSKTGKNITAHQLRMLFVEILCDHGADKNFVETVLGHKISHFEPESDKNLLKDKYLKFGDYLTLEEDFKYFNYKHQIFLELMEMMNSKEYQLLLGIIEKRDSDE
jgi:integrase